MTQSNIDIDSNYGTSWSIPSFRRHSETTVALDLVSVQPMNPPTSGGTTQKEIDEAKETLRNDIMDDIINNTNNVKDDDTRHELSQQKPTPAISIMYLDYVYDDVDNDKKKQIGSIISSLQRNIINKE